MCVGRARARLSSLRLVVMRHGAQALQGYVKGERAAAAAAVTDGPLAAAQQQVVELQVNRQGSGIDHLHAPVSSG